MPSTEVGDAHTISNSDRMPVSYRVKAMKLLVLALPLVAATFLPGCAVVAVADAAATVVSTGVSVTTKAVGAVADAVIPGK